MTLVITDRQCFDELNLCTVPLNSILSLHLLLLPAAVFLNSLKSSSALSLAQETSRGSSQEFVTVSS